MFDRKALTAAFHSIGKFPDFTIIQPHFLAVPSLLTGTSTVAIVPATLAKLFRQSGSASPSELPWQAPPSAVQMVWHERQTHDPGHQWLRKMLTNAVQRVTDLDS